MTWWCALTVCDICHDFLLFKRTHSGLKWCVLWFLMWCARTCHGTMWRQQATLRAGWRRTSTRCKMVWERRSSSSSISLNAKDLKFCFFSKVGMLFRFIATGIGGFVYPFTQVAFVFCPFTHVDPEKQCWDSLSELASLPGASHCGAGNGGDGWNHWEDHDRRGQRRDGHLWKGAKNPILHWK